MGYNNSLKPTETHVTVFAEEANPTPRFGGLVPPCTPREVGRLYGNYFASRKLWEV